MRSSGSTALNPIKAILDGFNFGVNHEKSMEESTRFFSNICGRLKLIGIPCIFPEGEMAIVLISAWASMEKTNTEIVVWGHS